MVAKDIFPFATVTDGCKDANFMGFSHEYCILDTTSKKLNFIEKFFEINLFSTVGHDYKGENILRNHDSLLSSR